MAGRSRVRFFFGFAFEQFKYLYLLPWRCARLGPGFALIADRSPPKQDWVPLETPTLLLVYARALVDATLHYFRRDIIGIFIPAALIPSYCSWRQ
jgi:hypothetical protein